MRITFVLPTLDLSGGCRVVSMYAQGLMDRGHQVTIVVPGSRRRGIRQAAAEFLKHGRLRAPRPRVSASHFKDSRVRICFVGWQRAVKGTAFPAGDILVATWWETMEWVNQAEKSCGAKVYFIQHHEVFDGLPLDRVRATYRMSAKRVTISRWIADILRDEYAIFDLTVIPNAVDHQVFKADFRERQKVPTIGFVYSKTSFKGSEVALAAIESVKRERPELKVLAFGCKVFQSNFPDYIELHVEPEQARIPDLYRACDVWICSSHAEGFNLPAMEAMACGTPVVSTRTGWPLEAIVDGENGFTVDPGNSSALGRRVLDVLDLDDKAWSRMSNAASSTATSQTWAKSIELMEAEFKRTYDGTPPSADRRFDADT